MPIALTNSSTFHGWVIYAKRPFGGPDAVLAHLARYTHRVAIASSRLVAIDRRGVTFRWKDYRARSAGKAWRKTMTLTAHEFIRRFLHPSADSPSTRTTC